MRILGTEDFSQSYPRALRQPFWAQLSSGGHPGGLANRVIHFSEQFVGSAFEFRSSSWMEFRSDIRLEDIPQFFQALGKHLDRVVNIEEVLGAVFIHAGFMNEDFLCEKTGGVRDLYFPLRREWISVLSAQLHLSWRNHQDLDVAKQLSRNTAYSLRCLALPPAVIFASYKR
jgi:hypothetical protein